MEQQAWPGEWLRGLLPAWALAVLASAPAHGYAVMQTLTGAGITGLRGGALYPVLNRLEQDGLVAATWLEGEGGPGRKVYRLTDAGRAELDALAGSWDAFAATTAALLCTTASASRSPTTAVAHSRKTEPSAPAGSAPAVDR